LGALKRASCVRTWSISSALVAVAFSLRATNATGTSPHFSSAAATTAASNTAGCEASDCSISTDEMFSPPEMMMSLARSRSSM
jgi:hypothetical protein